MTQENKISDKAVQMYLKEIDKFPVLSLKEEKELFKKLEKGDDKAREQITRAYLKLVIKIAEYYLPQAKNLTLLDLIQDGNLGLFRAVKLYDWKSKYRFSTFATIVIRKSIFRAIEDLGKISEPPKISNPKKRGFVCELPWDLETPLYQNKKGERVPWEKLTEEDKKEIKRKDRAEMKYELKKEAQKDIPETVELLNKVINISKLEAQQEIEKFLREK